MGWWRVGLGLLTAPSARIVDPVRQGSARLLASSILFITACFALLDAYWVSHLQGYSPPVGGYAFLLTGYALSRTRFFRLAALSTTVMFTMVAVVLVLSGSSPFTGSLVFAAVAPVFAGVFLGFRGVVTVGLINPLVIGAVPWLSRGRYAFEDVVTTLFVSVVIAVVTALYVAHRDWSDGERQRAAELREAQFQQMQKMEAIGRLAGGIAHDFNNLLTVIAGGVELLQRKGSSKETELIDQATRSARELTTQLLMLSRQGLIESGNCDVGEVLNAAQGLLGRIIGEDIEVVVELSPRLPRPAVSAGRLQQIVLNLATNARDAMPRGGVLHLSARPERGGVLLVASDSGAGMDEAVRQRIFEPFFTTKEVGKGTGLGLAMVFGIVSQSGGTVAVDSVPHEGTTFRLWFPRAEETSGELELASDGRVPVLRRGDGCILLVEDAAEVRGLCERVLTEAGYRVISASSPRVALDLFERNFKRIDLVVSDLVMPVLSGTEMVRAFRRRLPDLPVLFMSGYAPEDVTLEVLDRRSLLQKPFRPTDLLRAVDAILAPTKVP